MQALIPFPDIGSEIFSIQLFGTEFALRWYALSYIVGILLGWRLARRALLTPRLWKHDTAPMTAEQLEDLLTWIILGIVLGGRLGYVLFYKPAYYLQNPEQVLVLWEGGMAFHGGLAGVMLAVFFYCRPRGIPLLSAADTLALATPVGLMLGRIANFINGELWGRPTTLPWAVEFPDARAQVCPVDWVGPCGRHPSQLYEAGMEGLILGLVILFLVYQRGWLKLPGAIAGVFFAGYGLARFLVELVRQPDPQFMSPDNPVGLALHWHGWGLTMGQILSLPMMGLGALFLYLAWRRP